MTGCMATLGPKRHWWPPESLERGIDKPPATTENASVTIKRQKGRLMHKTTIIGGFGYGTRPNGESQC